MASLAVVALLVAFFAAFHHVYNQLDLTKHVYNHRPGKCRTIQGIQHGSEDVELVRSRNIAFVSSGVMGMHPENTHIQGKLFVYDFNSGTAKELRIRDAKFKPEDFHPHGLSHWEENGVVRLFAISHTARSEHSVEVFEYDAAGAALIHKETLRDQLLSKPNDLVAAGPRQFYFSNDGTAQSPLFSTLETLVRYRGGSVGYYDGKKFHTVLDSLRGPNGVMVDVKRGKLFVTAIFDELLLAYDIAKKPTAPVLLSSLELHTGCDNLFLAEDGSLYSGCHPILHEAAAHLKDCDNTKLSSPSQVLRFRYSKNYETAEVTEIYANDGREISASSVAVLFKNQMLIGSVCRSLLLCEVSEAALI